MRERETPEGEVEVTPEMVAAGAAVLAQLEGEVSQSSLAREVFLAMAACTHCHATNRS